MDFPKSVPSVGLVDGKFVDENTASGAPGSLIPAAWGNAVTQEILNVIDRAGLEPAEGDNGQLAQAIVELITGGLASSATEEVAGIAKIATDADFKAAVADDSKMVTVAKIKTWFSSVMRQATETASGWAKVATQSATNSGVDDTTFITPKKFSVALSALVIQATETVLGLAKIATQAKVNEGLDDNDMVTSKKLAVRLSSVFGSGQSYVNVTASRSAGVSYTNSTTRSILVMLSIATVVGAETVAIVVDGETIYSGDPGVNGQILPFTFVVAAGKSYSVSITSSTVINRWVEYR